MVRCNTGEGKGVRGKRREEIDRHESEGGGRMLHDVGGRERKGDEAELQREDGKRSRERKKR